MTCLQQKHTPPCIFICGLQVSRAVSARSAGAIACLLPSWAGTVPGAWLEDSAAWNLHSHTQLFFPCSIFLVDHFQWPIHVALCLRHGLFSLAQNDHEWKASNISCMALEKMFLMDNTNKVFIDFLLISHSLLWFALAWLFLPRLFLPLLLSDIPLFWSFFCLKENERERSWKIWGKGKKLNTYFLFWFSKFFCFLEHLEDFLCLICLMKLLIKKKKKSWIGG